MPLFGPVTARALGLGMGTWAGPVSNRQFAMGIWRSLLFIAITAWCALGVFFERLVFGLRPGRGAENIQGWARKLLWLVRDHLPITVEGEIPTGAGLLVANHRSAIDIPVIVAWKPTTFLAKAEIRALPILGWGAELAGVAFVQREDPTSRQRARESVGGVLATGASIVVFPEGTTNEARGLLPFRRGSFEVAAASGRPVTPVAIIYGAPGRFWPDEQGLVWHLIERLGGPKIPIRLVFGPSITSSDPAELLTYTHEWLLATLARYEEPIEGPTPTA